MGNLGLPGSVVGDVGLFEVGLVFPFGNLAADNLVLPGSVVEDFPVLFGVVFAVFPLVGGDLEEDESVFRVAPTPDWDLADAWPFCVACEAFPFDDGFGALTFCGNTFELPWGGVDLFGKALLFGEDLLFGKDLLFGE
jgi:hypothetical protein